MPCKRQLETENPILKENEFVMYCDNEDGGRDEQFIKIGDGKTRFNDLKLGSGGNIEIPFITIAKRGNENILSQIDGEIIKNTNSRVLIVRFGSRDIFCTLTKSNGFIDISGNLAYLVTNTILLIVTIKIYYKNNVFTITAKDESFEIPNENNIINTIQSSLPKQIPPLYEMDGTVGVLNDDETFTALTTESFEMLLDGTSLNIIIQSMTHNAILTVSSIFMEDNISLVCCGKNGEPIIFTI